MDIDTFSREFFRIESELGLPDWRIPIDVGHDFAPWPVIRFELFRTYSQKSGIFDWAKGASNSQGKPEKFVGVSGTDHLLSILGLQTPKRRKLFGDKGYSFARHLVTAENIVLPFGRRGSRGEDKFTDFLFSELGREAARLGNGLVDTSLGFPGFQELRRFAIKNYKSQSVVSLTKSMSDADLQLFSEVIVRLGNVLTIEIEEFSAFPIDLLSEFLAEYEFWDIFFKSSKAKRIFMPISQLALVGAARANGVLTVEIQHGLFNPYPMRFNWPGNPEIPYVPDEIWTWGDYWTRGFDLPAGQVVKVLGKNSDLVAALEITHEKKYGQVAFISQPAAWRQILEAAILTAKFSPKRNVIFRNHPGHENYEAAEALIRSGLSNLKLSTSEDEGILKLLGESEVVVGAFSTTLIEAVALGTPVVVLRVSSWVRLQGLIDSGDAILAAEIDEVPAAIEMAKIVSDPSYFYAEPANLFDLLQGRATFGDHK